MPFIWDIYAPMWKILAEGTNIVSEPIKKSSYKDFVGAPGAQLVIAWDRTLLTEIIYLTLVLIAFHFLVLCFTFSVLWNVRDMPVTFTVAHNVHTLRGFSLVDPFLHLSRQWISVLLHLHPLWALEVPSNLKGWEMVKPLGPLCLNWKA